MNLASNVLFGWLLVMLLGWWLNELHRPIRPTRASIRRRLKRVAILSVALYTLTDPIYAIAQPSCDEQFAWFERWHASGRDTVWPYRIANPLIAKSLMLCNGEIGGGQ